MQRIIVTAAAVLLGLAVTAAKADMNPGPVVDPGKGLCFKKTPNTESGTFGYWTDCPKPAAAAAASTAPVAPVHHRHTKRSDKDAEQAQ